MKILFSPSETKIKGGENKLLDTNSFIFPDLFQERINVINLYQDFINKATNKQLEKLFGTAKQEVIDYYKGKILDKGIMKVT